jgi:NodT family efflux transporter outer membrane factor (OMF) lipoprotein
MIWLANNFHDRHRFQKRMKIDCKTLCCGILRPPHADFKRFFRSDRLPAFLRFFLFSSFAFLGLSGCAVDSIGKRRPVSVPADWKNAHGFPVADPKRDLTRWWSRFNDPTLTRIISIALANNPDLASASSKVRESRARRTAVAASLFPTLNGGAAAGSSTTRRDGFGSDGSSNFSANLIASWEVDLYGKNRSLVDAASAQVGASEENLHSVQASLASEVAVAYTSLRVNEAALKVLRSNITTREETNRLASWRTQAGEADSLDSSQALSSLEQARAAVPALEQSISQARNLLALLAGKTPGSLDGTLKSGKQAIPDPAGSLAVGIPADTLRQRPDVRLAGYQLLAAAANNKAASAERFPSLDLTGSLGANALSSGKIFNPESTTAGIIAGLAGPIFNAGRIRANIDASNEVEEQAFQTYRAAVLTALSEVEDALIACRRTTERLETLEKATAAAREASTLAQQRYESGVTDILTVLDAQRSLLNLEASLFNARADRTNSYIQLYKALGGGWSSGS